MAAEPAATSEGQEATSAALVEEALARLRASGARITTTRRLLLRCLFSGSSHRTAEELAAEVQALAPDVHLSTIYRNLDELERLGIVVHAHLGHGPANYHLASEEHGHLVCEACGATFEAPEDLFRGLGDEAMARYGFAIDPRHFAVLGRCARCASGVTGRAPAPPPPPPGTPPR